MTKVCGIILCLLLAACSLQGDAKKKSARLRFEPGVQSTDPREPTSATSWSKLAPFPKHDSDKLTVLAHAGIGGKFPVGKEGEAALFEVRMKDGDDTHVSLEVITKEGTKSIEVQRDVPVPIEVAGVGYTLSFPTTYINASEEEATSKEATLFVSTLRK